MTNTTNEQERALQDLETIKSFLEEGQRNLSASGFHFILWGLLIPTAVAVYIALGPRLGNVQLFAAGYWPSVCGLGALTSIIAGIRDGKRERTRGFASRTHALLWIGFFAAIAVTFAIQIAVVHDATPSFLAHIAILLGIAYWIHGSLIRLTWFSLVALLWWITAIVVASLGLFAATIALGAATFICAFFPGVILSLRKAKGK